LKQSTKEKFEKDLDAILGLYADFFTVYILQNGKRCAISCDYNEAVIDRAADLDGKYLLYSNDTSLKATEVVNEYMEKDLSRRYSER
jgi:hypothetical protein